MTGMVQAAVAGDVTEAGEIQALLTAVGIESELQTEDEADALAVLARVLARGGAGRDRGDDRAGRAHLRALASRDVGPSAGRGRVRATL
jgi:hypothetical protein